jgi:hypothetical protein
VEDASFTDAEEVVIQCQPGVKSRVVALPRDVLQVRGDVALDPRLDDAIHLVPSRNADVRGVQQHVIGERVTLEGEHRA